MTLGQRLGVGLVVSAVSCGVSTVLAETAEARVFVVALLVTAAVAGTCYGRWRARQ
ncbi:hypothetical protein OHA25_16365 [Nonomuraea sp. NBC_00507]|uniref:hypothetical protein n=1 Tax=Nonomuraea sp. NBC_00507 TaxID=2976002 RepID=UPI002E1763D8